MHGQAFKRMGFACRLIWALGSFSVSLQSYHEKLHFL
jgi:hypothetical protein